MRVTFKTDEAFFIFSFNCSILGGSPSATPVHIFDFPYEEDDTPLLSLLLVLMVQLKISLNRTIMVLLFLLPRMLLSWILLRLSFKLLAAIAVVLGTVGNL